MTFYQKSPEKFLFSWISEDKISEEEMKIYKEVENSKGIMFIIILFYFYKNKNFEIIYIIII